MDTREVARPDTASLLALISARRGHFCLESGHHGALWLDLDPLFADPDGVAPFVSVLADALRPHDVSIVCGPLQGGAFLAQLVAGTLGAQFWYTDKCAPAVTSGLYRARYALPASLAARARGARVAIVDDVMSAGSSLRATYTELQSHGAEVVVAGALLVLGTTGADYFAGERIPVEYACRDMYELWAPADCPLCVAGVPLESVSS